MSEIQRLPLADEIAEARVRAKRAESAALLLQQCGIALSAAAVIGRQLESIANYDYELPGTDVVEQGMEEWSELAGLADIQPDPDAPFRKQLEQRRLQLRTVEQVLQPEAAKQDTLNHRVHELQHEQSHIMRQPEWDELREALNVRAEVRRKCINTLARLRMRRQSLLPSSSAIDEFLPQLRHELDHLDEGFNRQFARNRLLTLVTTISATARALNLYAQLPDPSLLLSADTEDQVLHDAVTALEVLRDAAGRETETLQAEIDRVQAELDEATEWMLARTG